MNGTPANAVRRILVVDDNTIVQRSLQMAIQGRGYEVLLAGDIPDALKLIRSERPDLVLLDINFPPDAATVGGSQRDGFWTLEWLRYLENFKGIPIILISSDEPEKIRPRAVAAGAADYFQKPIKPDELAARIAQLLSGKPAA